ncbi:1-aminocyclopropane-1-carboxylate deaminase [Cellulophaga algicola DSM 14237]|uniref:1-aminocyclopropane-1-carboxylate deaminase n=1 Tax=Cellulophaga algicola (strain DSM 14237 / IC166 / ACAM 630) TaxID=688270 RepID=E6XES7_CELAD|nr:1-aminocyclopropane-1-carboxylate deaminase [Cellulophaga algicola DSM 14237]
MHSALLNIFDYPKKDGRVISSNQKIELPILNNKKITLCIKREDELHPFISGNKYRKLKYNIKEAENRGIKTLLTYGGAYSNHIAATAYAGKEYGFNTLGIIRGEELKEKWQENPTLKFAHANGMQFKFVTRDWYRGKEELVAIEGLKKEFGSFYRIPEGGTNSLAVLGCEEILDIKDLDFDVIATCVGTGGTISGIINSSREHQTTIGFPALKGDFLKKDICKFVKKSNWVLETKYNFGGYGKISKELVDFINDFKLKTSIPLDPVYTGKMMFGILDLVAQDYFKPGTKILAIHTGGLQGISGMNKVLKNKNLPVLEL